MLSIVYLPLGLSCGSSIASFPFARDAMKMSWSLSLHRPSGAENGELLGAGTSITLEVNWSAANGGLRDGG